MSLFKHLHEKGIWRGYERHVMMLNSVLERMVARGIPIDPATFAEVVATLEGAYAKAKEEMQEMVPDEIKPRKVYKTKPTKILPWNPSNKGLLAYIKAKKHKVPTDYKTGKET